MDRIDSTIETPMPMKRAFMKLIFVFRDEFQEQLDDEHLQLTLANVPRHDHAYQRHISEHGDRDTEHHGDRKAANRACAEGEQQQGRDQGCNIRIHNGGEGAMEALVQRGHGPEAASRFFADTFIDENIGVNRDTNTENDTGDTRAMSALRQ